MTTEHTELAAAPDPRPVQIVRRDLAQGQSVFRRDVAGLLAEYDRLRAVLARPAAGRDLTVQDVQRAYDGTMRWEPIANYLNSIARPAVARTDGQPPADDAESVAFLDRFRAAGIDASAPADDTASTTPFTVDQEVRSASGVRGTVRTANYTYSLVTWSNGNVVWVRNDELAPADDPAAPDGPPTTITVTLLAAEHDIDGEDAHGRWTQNPAWETPGIDRGVISAWAQGVCIEDVLHDEGDVIELEETARKVLAAVEQHRHLARRLADEGSAS